ncbi:hypothetical protein AB0953_29700 [Streptomyces sp. NPDC046866]
MTTTMRLPPATGAQRTGSETVPRPEEPIFTALAARWETEARTRARPGG